MTPLPLAFLHGNPAQAFIPDVQEVVARSQRLDAVVAFVTRPGAQFFHQFADALVGEASLTASVRSPTDLRALIKVSRKYPGSIRIHTMHAREGKSPPRELMHSKLVLSLRTDGQYDLLVGSHNWTGTALGGVNREASVHTVIPAGHPTRDEVVQHIQQVKAESVILDDSNLDELLALQKALGGSGSGPVVPGIRDWPATVIHAEVDDDDLRDEAELLVYVSPKPREGLLERFAVGRQVDLWLYKRSSLHGHSPPQSLPVLFRGRTDMLNDADSGRVTDRPVRQQLLALDAPMLQAIGGLPSREHPSLQVVLGLARIGEMEPHLYGAGSKPRLKSKITEEYVDHPLTAWAQRMGTKMTVFEPRLTEVEAVVQVPSYGLLYEPSVTERLSDRISRHAQKKVRKTGRARVVETKPRRGESPYFYDAKHIIDVDEP